MPQPMPEIPHLQRFFRLFSALLLAVVVSMTAVFPAEQHLLIYYPPYQSQAQKIKDFLNKRGIETLLMPAPYGFSSDREYPADTAPSWKTFWESLVGTGESASAMLMVDPLMILNGQYLNGVTPATFVWDGTRNMYPHGALVDGRLATIAHVTILGNPLEIPPSSTILRGNIRQPTDHYYSLKGTLSDFVPDHTVSRIPITVTDSTNQMDLFNIAGTTPSFSTINTRGWATFRSSNAGELNGVSIYLNLPNHKDPNPTSLLVNVADNTSIKSPTTLDGNVKLIVTRTVSGYALPSIATHPHIVRKIPSDKNAKGAFAYYANSGNFVEALHIKSIGNFTYSVTVGNEVLLGTVKAVAAGAGQISADPTSISTSLATALATSGNYLLISQGGADKGDNYVMVNFTSPAFTVDSSIGDTPDNDLKDQTLEVWRYTAADTSIKGTGTKNASDGGIASVKYISPGTLSGTPTTGTAYDLRGAATRIVDKVVAWGEYVWSNSSDATSVLASGLGQGGKPDFFNSALVAIPINDYRWDYYYEHIALDLVNYYDSALSASPSVFNGFRVVKVFPSNDNYSGNATHPRIRPGINRLSNNVAARITSIAQGTDQGSYGGIIQLVQVNQGEAAIRLTGNSAEKFQVLIQESTPGSSALSNPLPAEYTVATAGNPTKIAFAGYGGSFIVNGTTTVRVHVRDANDQLVTSSSNSLTFQLASNTATISGINVGGAVTDGALNTQRVTFPAANGVAEIKILDTSAENFLVVVTNAGNVLANPQQLTVNSVASSVGTPIRIEVSTSSSFSGVGSVAELRVQIQDSNGLRLNTDNTTIVRFELNPFPSTDMIAQTSGKGIFYMTDNFESIFGNTTNWNSSHFQNTGVTPELPLVIAGGENGFDLTYDPENIERWIGYGTASLSYRPSGNTFAGSIGYIGYHSHSLYIKRPPIDTTFEWGYPILTNPVDVHWDKGAFKPELMARHILAREAVREYSSASQPTIGTLWKESITGYLDDLMTKYPSVFKTRSDAAKYAIADLERWGAIGLSAQELPVHKYWPHKFNSATSDFVADEVPVPSVTVTSASLRSTDTYDRYEIPVVEIPDSATSGQNVTFSITNASSYPSGTDFRVTLVALPLVNPRDSVFELHGRISQLDFSAPPQQGEVSYTLFANSGNASSFSLPFYPTWGRSSGTTGTLQRGPSLYTLRVEALEPAHSGELSTAQKTAQYTKETRLYFRVVNKFTLYDETMFLLVNNTDHDPYQLRYFWNNMVPSTSIRYYADALDNYQYTRGTLSLSSAASGGSATFSADVNSNTYWDQRLAAGDKIRALDLSTNLFSPWHRITSVGTASIAVSDGDSTFSSTTNYKKTLYVSQRAYTEGYALLTYTSAAGTNSGKPTVSTTGVKLILPGSDYLGFSDVVKTGDYFKLLDEGTYSEITALSVAGNVASITLASEYPLDSLYHYHAQPTGQFWGEGSMLASTASGNILGSYAIYPSTGSGSSKRPLYLYQTWHVHNFNTANTTGQGLYGDVTQGILDSFAKGDSTSRRHKAVVWAHESGYEVNDWNILVGLTGRELNRNFSTGDTTGDAGIILEGNLPIHYFSVKDKARIASFLSLGGRLLTGGQWVDAGNTTMDDSFYDTLGVAIQHSGNGTGIIQITDSGLRALKKVPGDPITDKFENNLDIQGGVSPNTTKQVDNEASLCVYNPSPLFIRKGQGLPFVYYGGTGSAGGETIAGVRASGGPNERPYGTVFAGFDFGTLSPSGARSIYKPLSDSLEEGRRLLLKQSLDWLRDPSRTSESQILKIIYHAKLADGTLYAITLSTDNTITVNTAVHTAAGITGGVGPNSDLIFSAQGGQIYDLTSYSWVVASTGTGGAKQPTLTVDSNYPGNSRIVFRTGDLTTGSDTIRLTGPDGSVRNLVIAPQKFPLSFTVQNSGNAVVGGKILNTAGATVKIVALGGDGLGSYIYSVIPGDPIFSNSTLISAGSESVTYTLPNAVITDTVSVTFLVESGSQSATATLKILAPVNFTASSDTFTVVGGAPAHLVAAGGDGSYTFSTTDSGMVKLTDDTDKKGTSVAGLTTASISIDPNSPSVSTIQVQSFGSVNYGYVKVYSAPVLRYRLDSASGWTNIADGDKVPLPTGGQLELNVAGGLTTATWRVLDETLSTTNVLRRVSDSSEYAKGGSFTASYATTAQALLLTGTTGSGNSVTLSINSGGSTISRTINLVSSINVTPTPTAMKFSTSKQFTVATGTAPYTWTFVPSNLGTGFATSSTGNAVTTLSGSGTSVYFFSGSTTEQGTISVTDTNGNLGTAFVYVNTDGTIPATSGTAPPTTTTTGTTGAAAGVTTLQGGAPPAPAIAGGGCFMSGTTFMVRAGGDYDGDVTVGSSPEFFVPGAGTPMSTDSQPAKAAHSTPKGR